MNEDIKELVEALKATLPLIEDAILNAATSCSLAEEHDYVDERWKTIFNNLRAQEKHTRTLIAYHESA